MRTKKVKVMKAKEIQEIIINGFKERLKGKIGRLTFSQLVA